MAEFAFPHHPIKYPFHAFRGRLVQPFFWALFFLSPVLHLYQMDVIHQRLIAWGRVYPLNPVTLMWLPLGFFGCVVLIGLVSTFGGRLFCGWVCPHNTMTEWTYALRRWIGLGTLSFRQKQRERKRPWHKGVRIASSLLGAIALTYLISALFLFYFVPVSWFFHHLQAGTLPFIIWAGQALMMIIGLFMIYAGHEFCRNACPYGLLQSLSAYMSSKWIPMEIRYMFGSDQSACKSCHACQTACPVDIDPRNPENLVVGVGEGCFNCGECIDACSYVRAPQGEQKLLSFAPPTLSHGTTSHGREIAD